MFLRKLFSSKNKFTWVIIDFIIVILGVYIAFALQSRAENARTKKEKEKVYTALKYELEFFRYRTYQTKLGMDATLRELTTHLDAGDYSDYSNYRFIEPQYDYQTIQYALELHNTDIVDFELYDALQALFVEIKKIEHVERLLTETSRMYLSIPSNLEQNSAEFKLTRSQNMDNFRRFIVLIDDRGNISERISIAASNALDVLNKRIGLKNTRKMEEKIIKENVHLIGDEQKTIALVKKLYPKFSETELKKMYQQAISSSD